MKNTAHCGTYHAYEIFGVILIVIGALLTIITGSAAGIFMLFLVGLVLCCHKYLAFCCHEHPTEVVHTPVYPTEPPVVEKTVK